MKGNYQNQAPLMKLSPEFIEKSSRIYQIQQYTIWPANSILPNRITFTMIGSDPSAKTYSGL